MILTMQKIEQASDNSNPAEATHTNLAPISALVTTQNALGAKTVRLSDDDLHRAACNTNGAKD